MLVQSEWKSYTKHLIVRYSRHIEVHSLPFQMRVPTSTRGYVLLHAFSLLFHISEIERVSNGTPPVYVNPTNRNNRNGASRGRVVHAATYPAASVRDCSCCVLCFFFCRYFQSRQSACSGWRNCSDRRACRRLRSQRCTDACALQYSTAARFIRTKGSLTNEEEGY